MDTVSYETVVADLEAHPAKRIFWRAGWAYRGAREREISRAPHELKACFRWACVVELDANTDAEMHLNGLSCSDME